MKKPGAGPGTFVLGWRAGLAPNPVALARFAPQLLLQELTEAGCFLTLLLHTRFFVVLTASSLGEDAIHGDALVEALQGTFERLVIADDYVRQSGVSPRLLRTLPMRAAGR